jgi:hypothetical protein
LIAGIYSPAPTTPNTDKEEHWDHDESRNIGNMNISKDRDIFIEVLGIPVTLPYTEPVYV